MLSQNEETAIKKLIFDYLADNLSIEVKINKYGEEYNVTVYLENPETGKFESIETTVVEPIVHY